MRLIDIELHCTTNCNRCGKEVLNVWPSDQYVLIPSRQHFKHDMSMDLVCSDCVTDYERDNRALLVDAAEKEFCEHYGVESIEQWEREQHQQAVEFDMSYAAV